MKELIRITKYFDGYMFVMESKRPCSTPIRETDTITELHFEFIKETDFAKAVKASLS